MTRLTLTEDELRDLTKRRRHTAQARALRAIGVEHLVRPDGSLVVLRSHVERLFGESPAKARQHREYEIDRSIM